MSDLPDDASRGFLPRGRFISVEGGEGAGKSTQIALVEALLREAGHNVVRTREPGGTPLAEELRALLLAPRSERVAGITELLLMFAARAQHVQEVIEPALQRGDWVVSDRFTDASIAYQGAGRGMDTALIAQLQTLVLGTFAPDLTLLLDVPVACGMSRVGMRGAQDRFELEQEAFHARVRDCYLRLARENPARIRVIDAGAALANVANAVRESMHEYLDAFSRGVVAHD